MDIVDRLRHTEEETATIGQELVYLQVPVNPDGPEAADEIERLRKIVDRLSDWKEVNGVRVLMKDYYETEIERLRNKARWVEMVESTVVKQDAEIERLRRIMTSILNACKDVNSPDRKVREEITKNVRKALKYEIKFFNSMIPKEDE